MSRKLDTSKMFYREMKIEQESVSEAVSYTHLDVYKRQGMTSHYTKTFLEHSFVNSETKVRGFITDV